MDTAPINAYLELAIEILNKWVSNAKDQIIPDFEKIIAATSMIKHQLKSINKSINRLKEDIKDLFEAYKDLEKEYGLEPLSLEYYHASLENREKIKKLIAEIQSIAGSFQYIMDRMEENHFDIDTYITSANQNSIHFLQGLTEEDLLKLLEDVRLVGF
jgi:archaellum component FlaC